MPEHKIIMELEFDCDENTEKMSLDQADYKVRTLLASLPRLKITRVVRKEKIVSLGENK